MITFKGKLLTAYSRDELMTIVSELVLASLRKEMAASKEKEILGRFIVYNAGEDSFYEADQS